MFFLNFHKVDGYNIKIINNIYILSEAKLCILRELSHWCHYLLRKVISFVMEIVLFVSTVVTALPKQMLFQLTLAF